MVNIGPAEILFGLLLLLFLSLIAGMFLAWGWVLQRLFRGRPILPERPMVTRTEAPWGVWTVLLVVLVYLLVSSVIPLVYAVATGRTPAKPAVAPEAPAKWNRNPHDETKKPIPADSGAADTKVPAKDPAVDGRPPPPQPTAAAPNAKPPQAPGAQIAPAEPEPVFLMPEMMAVFAVTDLVLLGLLSVLVRITSGATLRDLGLSFEGWPRQAALGIVATLTAAPLVYSVQILAIQIWEYKQHPLQKMLDKDFSLGIADLAILSGVIVAPVFEEFLFRGILQSWLVRLVGSSAPELPPKPWQPVSEPGEGPAGSRSWDPDFGYWEADDQPGLAALKAMHENPFQPSASWATSLAGPAPPRQTPSTPDPAPGAPPRSGRLAIVLTSLLFAGVHAGQWPAPIALFFLALVIGTVYHRTGSLIAAIFVHATFNGLSMLAMFTALLGGQIVDASKAKVSWSEAPRNGIPSARQARMDAPPVVKSELGPDFSRRHGIGLLKF